MRRGRYNTRKKYRWQGITNMRKLYGRHPELELVKEIGLDHVVEILHKIGQRANAMARHWSDIRCENDCVMRSIIKAEFMIYLKCSSSSSS